MQIFIVDNTEVAEVELRGENFPITQQGAVEFIKRQDALLRKSLKRRSRACYGNQRMQSQVC